MSDFNSWRLVQQTSPAHLLERVSGGSAQDLRGYGRSPFCESRQSRMTRRDWVCFTDLPSSVFAPTSREREGILLYGSDTRDTGPARDEKTQEETPAVAEFQSHGVDELWTKRGRLLRLWCQYLRNGKVAESQQGERSKCKGRSASDVRDDWRAAGTNEDAVSTPRLMSLKFLVRGSGSTRTSSGGTLGAINGTTE